ncbi:MAG: DUF4080 domain-containing protein [Nannocystaceae bacterium]
MTDIVLATVNAKYIHTAFGLRYLLANMGELRARTSLIEFTIQQRPIDIVEALLAQHPKIVGIGVYIWNTTLTRAVVALLKSVAPEVTVVLGGPEVSHEIEEQAWLASADFVITGEGDLAFRELCQRLETGKRPLQRVLDGGLPDLAQLELPYALYDDHDVAHRIAYVEASRGCPYRCEFCLSALDKSVRAFPLEKLLVAFDDLLARNVRHFKFVDRTFNLDLERSVAILEYFLARLLPGLFLHFELVPDRLPAALREPISRFPPGVLQFEVGVQSLDHEVGRRIRRRQDLGRTFENLRFLREEAGVHLHTDLIVGLPGEGIASFGNGLDRLVASGVQEVQVGVLKRLRGTPISRHTDEFSMVYDPLAPYEILKNADISFADMQRMKRFALVWDTYSNQGNFQGSMRALWGSDSPFERTLAFSDWLFTQAGRVHGISLHNRARYLFSYLVRERSMDAGLANASLIRDYADAGRNKPSDFELVSFEKAATTVQRKTIPARQSRHL